MPFLLKKKKSLIILVVLIFFQLILISIQVPLDREESYFEKAIFSIFSPVQHGIVYFFQKIGNIWKNYFYLHNVQDQNEEMKKEIFFLLQENNLLRTAMQKYKSEKEIRDTLSKIHKNILPARVIGFDASNFYKSATINKGALDGIRKNMVVLDKHSNLVGRVIEPISFKEARIQLVTDSESGISVFSQKEKVPGVLTGDAKGQCFLNYIEITDEEVREGGCVITSGFDGIFPPGINVGEILSVIPSTSLFKTIKVKPFFEIRNLDHIAVIMLDINEFF